MLPFLIFFQDYKDFDIFIHNFKTIYKKKSKEDEQDTEKNKVLTVGNHTYALRSNILYTEVELKQLESDYQEIISQMSIPNEVSLSKKIKKMSNVLYNNQHQLNQKPIYDSTIFKAMLEAADKGLRKSLIHVRCRDA